MVTKRDDDRQPTDRQGEYRAICLLKVGRQSFAIPPCFKASLHRQLLSEQDSVLAQCSAPWDPEESRGVSFKSLKRSRRIQSALVTCLRLLHCCRMILERKLSLHLKASLIICCSPAATSLLEQ